MLAEREMPVSQYISLQDKLSKQHISLKKKKKSYKLMNHSNKSAITVEGK